ncbi:MAG: serine protease AprX [Solirubrobacteraceae bacterium]|nr:serine protease AprX [Solirubrobacteraceae bacterium]
MTLTLSHLAWRPRAILAMLAAVILAGAAFLLHAAPAPRASVSSGLPSSSAASGSLADIARNDPTRPVEVIVQFAGPARFADGRTLLAANGAKVTRDLHIIDAYGVRMSAGAAQRLGGNPAVKSVTLNAVVKPSGAGITPDGSSNVWGRKDCGGRSPSWLTSDVCTLRTSYLQSTRTQKLWDAAGPAGGGQGVTVAVIDTGVAGGLPDFRTSPSNAASRVIASVVTNPDATTEDDLYGHGTHVAGLIAGNGSLRDAGDPLRGQYVGAAPRANLVSVKVSDDQGATSLIDVIYGLQFAIDHQSQYDIRVINLSLNSDTPGSAATDPLDAAVESAWMHGIVVVAAAGNRGTASDAVSYAPGNDPYVITVGSVDDQGTKRTSDDEVTDWSSRGVTQDGIAKPDVVAPGAHMVAPYAPNSAFGTACPACIVDGQYFRVGGTSMSTAVVSGIVADLIELHPTWTPDQVKGALTHQLRTVAGGAGEVDAQRATQATRRDLVANVGLTPNTLLDPATGDIDYTRASWSRASWSKVEGDRASWSRASWSRASWSRASWSCDCEVAVTGDELTNDVEADRASWSRASWSRASWSRASWSRASWSASFTK